MNKKLFPTCIKLFLLLAILAGMLAKPLINSTAGIDSGTSSPVAEDQAVTTAEETALPITLTATDADGAPLTYAIAGAPAHGVLEGEPPLVTYTPELDFAGSDSFTFTASDGDWVSNPGTVSIMVTNVNDPPVAVPDHYSTALNTVLNVSRTVGVLHNDYDVDSPTLTVSLVQDAPTGVLTLKSDGSFIYKPQTGFTGTVTFTYIIYDGQAVSNTAVVAIDVNLANSVPVANADTYQMYNGLTLYADEAQGLLANDSDLDGDLLTAKLIGGVAFGTLTLNEDGSFVYTPNPYYLGDDHFTYQAYDGKVYSTPAMVTITVSINPNKAPLAEPDAYQVDGSLLVVDAADGVLVNDSDPNDDTLTANLVTDVAHGDLTLNPDGSFVYTPQAGFYWYDQFIYCSCDGQLLSGPVTVDILVLPPNKIFLPTLLK